MGGHPVRQNEKKESGGDDDRDPFEQPALPRRLRIEQLRRKQPEDGRGLRRHRNRLHRLRRRRTDPRFFKYPVDNRSESYLDLSQRNVRTLYAPDAEIIVLEGYEKESPQHEAVGFDELTRR